MRSSRPPVLPTTMIQTASGWWFTNGWAQSATRCASAVCRALVPTASHSVCCSFQYPTVRPTTLSESTRQTALTPTPHENLIGAAQPNQASVKAAAPLLAGVARVSINPMEEKIDVQLGGYGAREGKPAEGTLDTINGKVILFESDGEKSAVITVDMCSVPICVAEGQPLARPAIKGLTLDRMLIFGQHTHAGLSRLFARSAERCQQSEHRDLLRTGPELRHGPPGQVPPGSGRRLAAGKSCVLGR